MQYLRQSTAFTFRAGPFLDKTDGATFETALTIAQADIQISKNGGAFGQTSGVTPTTTYDSMGHYQCPITGTDTATAGPMRVVIAKTVDALPVFHDFMVIPGNVYDSLVSGSDLLDVSATQLAGQTVTAAAGVTFPTSVASPTNITAATGVTLTATTGLGNQTANITGNVSGSVGSVTGAVGSVTGNVGGTVATVTTLTNLPSIPANWLTAAGIAATALNGKGDWNVGKTGYSLTATTGMGNQTSNITGNLSGSVGSVTGAVGSVTGNVGGNVVGSVASVTAPVLLSNGTGAGQVSLSSGAVKVQSGIKKAQALANFPFAMTDSTNHNPATGATVTATRSLDGGAFAAGTISGMTEIGVGMYQCDLGTGDMAGDTVTLRFTAGGCDDLLITLVTTP